jgi:mRNA interferase MazF
MRQGDIWLADLDPTEGSEQAGRRPVVVISGDTMNSALPVAIVVPMSSQLKSYPTSVLLRPNRVNGLKKDAEALPFQVRTLAKVRFIKRIGRVTPEELRNIVKGLFVVLTY